MDLNARCVAALEAVLAPLRPIVADVRVGVFYTAVRLDTGHAGVAFTPRDLADTVCCPRSAAQAPPAGSVAGRDAWELAAYAQSRVPLRRAIGVAVINALSALAMQQHGVPGGRKVPDLDALEAAGVHASDRVAMVGAFTPFIKALKGRVARLRVIDRHKEALKPDEHDLWCDPAQAAAALADADIAIITGSAQIEGGLEALLGAARGARSVVLAGPTASGWPTPYFERGVHVLAGIEILDPERILRVVSEGGSGYFFEGAARKVCLVRDPPAVRAATG
ncbi:MAG: DUF364 domain-containing protein [Gammaproteobacteria bacterium]